MTDEIASFKVTAADIQKQKVHPSGDVHMQEGSHFSHNYLVFSEYKNIHGVNDLYKYQSENGPPKLICSHIYINKLFFRVKH